MSKKILYLPLETIVRDLDPALLLAFHALQRGYRVVMGTKSEVQRFARHVGGGVYLYKHWESLFPYPFDDPRRAKYCYVGFHQEALVWIDTDTFRRRFTEKGKSHKLDLNFVRGRVQRELLLEVNPALEPILKVVGSPGIDLLREKYRPLFKDHADRLAREWGPFVLINTNFSPGNRHQDDTADIVAQREHSSIKNVGRPLTEEERQTILESIEYKRALFKEYVVMLRAMSKAFPSLTFILRPHPSEDHDQWRTMLAGLPNVHVRFEGDVVNWILAARALIHTGCTTAIETWALRRPVLRYNPLGPTSRFESPLPNQFGRYVKTLTELESALHEVIGGKYIDSFEEQKHGAKPYIESIEGEEAVVHMLQYIDEVWKAPAEAVGAYDQDVRSYRTLSRRFRGWWWRGFMRISQYPHLLRYVVGERRARIWAARFQKFPYLSDAFIKRTLDTLAHIEGKEVSPTRIRRVDANTFLLDPSAL